MVDLPDDLPPLVALLDGLTGLYVFNQELLVGAQGHFVELRILSLRLYLLWRLLARLIELKVR